MSVRNTTIIETRCNLANVYNDVFITAFEWQNNIFKLGEIRYWTFTMTWIPEQVYISHNKLSTKDRQLILAALVKEWNLYQLKPKKLADCLLVCDDPTAKY